MFYILLKKGLKVIKYEPDKFTLEYGLSVIFSKCSSEDIKLRLSHAFMQSFGHR